MLDQAFSMQTIGNLKIRLVLYSKAQCPQIVRSLVMLCTLISDCGTQWYMFLRSDQVTTLFGIVIVSSKLQVLCFHDRRLMSVSYPRC